MGAAATTPVDDVLGRVDERMTTAQRAVLALEVLPRLEEEASRSGEEARGKHKHGRGAEEAAALVGIGASTVAAAKAIQKRDESGAIIGAMRSGDITVAEAARRAGFEALGQGSTSRATKLPDGSPYFGKGDKWTEAISPALRYFRGWRGRDFQFSHVNYKDARRRLALLDELAKDIERAREDLARRADPARLRV